MNAPTIVSVALGERSYDILVGPDLLADAARHLGPLIARPPVVVVTDRKPSGMQGGRYGVVGIEKVEIRTAPDQVSHKRSGALSFLVPKADNSIVGDLLNGYESRSQQMSAKKLAKLRWG